MLPDVLQILLTISVTCLRKPEKIFQQLEAIQKIIRKLTTFKLESEQVQWLSNRVETSGPALSLIPSTIFCWCLLI